MKQHAPFAAIPVLDMAPWFDGDQQARQAVAERCLEICSTVGFMYVENHRVAESVIAATFAAAAEFFDLPTEQKLRVDAALARGVRGYRALRSEAHDLVGAPDEKEGFDLGLTIEDPEAPAIMTTANLWPEHPAGFRPAIEQHFSAMLEFARELFAVFAQALRLPDGWFDAALDEPIAQMRVLHYPERQGDQAANAFGIGAHTDFEALTVLVQDDAGGLQVQNRSGEWIDAPPIPGTFVINIGEMLARWTNGRFVATPHRVVNTAGRERYSIPFFFAPGYRTSLAPLPGTADADSPMHARAVTAAAFLAEKAAEVQVGNVPVETGV